MACIVTLDIITIISLGAKKKKKKTKGDEHLVRAVIVTLTLARLHFDTLQKVWKVSMPGLLSAGISFSLNASQKRQDRFFPRDSYEILFTPYTI